MVELKQDERLDDLERNGYKIIQNPNKFCFGMDAVLLSGFTQVKPGERALDMGTGTELFPYFSRQKPRVLILPDWRFRKKAQTWRGGVSLIIIWRRKWIL